MSEGLRDVLRVVTALAALLGAVAAVVGAVQSHRNGLDIAELRGRGDGDGRHREPTRQRARGCTRRGTEGDPKRRACGAGLRPSAFGTGTHAS